MENKPQDNKQIYTGYRDNNDQENSQNFYHLNTVLQRMTLFYQNEKNLRIMNKSISLPKTHQFNNKMPARQNVNITQLPHH
jgi:hypothetical protein